MFRQLFEEAIAESTPSAVDIAAVLAKAGRRGRIRRFMAIGGAAVAVVAVTASAMAVLGRTPAARIVGPEPASSASLTPPEVIDWFDANDLDFYRQFGPYETIRFTAPPNDLRTATEQSTAVVLAQIVDVRATRSIGAPPIDMAAFVLRPVEVIAGRLRPELAGVVEVEFFLLPGDPAGLAAIRRDLPKGLAVWFLRWQGEPSHTVKRGAPSVDPVADRSLYGTVHPTMVFASGPAGIFSAFMLNDPGMTADYAPGEALSFAKLSDLVADLRGR